MGMTSTHYTAFADGRRIASGTHAQVAEVLRQLPPQLPAFFIFDDSTGSPVDLDLREAAIGLASAPSQDGQPASAPTPDQPAPRSVGRPKLGVVAREVTLLPRHWDWLNRQPGGASVALRKLVEDARRVNASRDAVRAAREVAYRFMSAIAGHEPGFEEASRALFAGQATAFAQRTAGWPADVRTHLAQLTAAAWGEGEGEPDSV